MAVGRARLHTWSSETTSKLVMCATRGTSSSSSCSPPRSPSSPRPAWARRSSGGCSASRSSGALAFFISRLYREYRVTLYGLGDRNRGLLYGAVGVTVLTLTGTRLLWQTAIGTLAWFALLGAAIYAAVFVYRESREY